MDWTSEPQILQLAGTGLEFPEKSREKKGNHGGGGTASGTTDRPILSKPDPDLIRLIDAWPALPAAIRAGILAMVNTTSPTGEKI
jgi:hypothetical protein